MRLNLYIVRDMTLAQDWNIAEAKNDTVAMREFQKIMKDKDYPDEFILFNIGWWDHELSEGALTKPYQVRPEVDKQSDWEIVQPDEPDQEKQA